MERKIKFRGKSLARGVWVYGDLLRVSGDNPRIIEDAEYFDDSLYNLTGKSVKSDTLGQFTCLHDCNGKEIYEGDIIKTPRGNVGEIIFGKAEETVTHYVFRRKVTDVYTTYGWVFKRIKDGCKCAVDDSILDGCCIGNIYDNPELIR